MIDKVSSSSSRLARLMHHHKKRLTGEKSPSSFHPPSLAQKFLRFFFLRIQRRMQKQFIKYSTGINARTLRFSERIKGFDIFSIFFAIGVIYLKKLANLMGSSSPWKYIEHLWSDATNFALDKSRLHVAKLALRLKDDLLLLQVVEDVGWN